MRRYVPGAPNLCHLGAIRVQVYHHPASDQPPERAIGLTMRAQQIPGDDRRLADSQREALRFHPVCDAEEHCLNSSR